MTTASPHIVGSRSAHESTRTALARWLPQALGLDELSECLRLLPSTKLRVFGCRKKDAVRFLELLAGLNSRKLAQSWDRTAAQFDLPNPIFIGIERIVDQEQSKTSPAPANEAHAPQYMLTRKYKVALSFASEKRSFISRVAKTLQKNLGREQVLYDQEFQPEFARLNLDQHLPSLYRKESELICVFLCNNYSHKEWCGLEWRHIRQLINTKDEHRIMLLSFGSLSEKSELEDMGILRGDGILKIGSSKSKTTSQVADRILERLAMIIADNVK